MENAAEMYMQEETVSNHIKGFTKSFQKRSKAKKVEDQDVVELLAFNREKKLIFGARVAEKMLKNGLTKKIYTSANPDELTLAKLKHYGKISTVEILELSLDNEELGQKLGKPFNVSIVSVSAK